MSRRDEISKYYDISNIADTISTWTFWINIILSIIVLFLQSYPVVSSVLMKVIIILSFVCPIISVIDDSFWWYDAESKRRKSCIKDAFGVDTIEENVEEYYNNSFSPSYNKYVLNTFENTFFSKYIAQKMLIPSAIYSLISFIVFILICILVKNDDIVLIIAQTVFSANYICGTLSLLVYKKRLDNLYNDFYNILVTIGVNDAKQKVLILANIVEYESIKAHYKIRLSTKVFTKLNPSLSTEWSNMVSRCKINSLKTTAPEGTAVNDQI